MISLKEALVRKNRSIDIDELTRQEIWEYINEYYQFSDDTSHYVKAEQLKSKIEITSDGIVNAPGLSIRYINNSADALTNGKFRFGKCSAFIVKDKYSLKSLRGAPAEITRYLYCTDCPKLESINEDITIQREPAAVFMPSVDFSGCRSLKSLKGLNIAICDDFSIRRCQNLKDLQGGPTAYCVTLNCRGCVGLKSLNGAPYEVRKRMYCSDCSSLKQFKDIENKRIKEIEIDEDMYNKFVSGKIKCPNNYKFSSWTYPTPRFYLYHKK